jgi:hypothetical protein
VSAVSGKDKGTRHTEPCGHARLRFSPEKVYPVGVGLAVGVPLHAGPSAQNAINAATAVSEPRRRFSASYARARIGPSRVPRR